MTSGKPAVFDPERVVRMFRERSTLNEIALAEHVHRSVISKFLKSRGFVIMPSRGMGVSPRKRIEIARERIAKEMQVLASYGVSWAAPQNLNRNASTFGGGGKCCHGTSLNIHCAACGSDSSLTREKT
jgi:hypothetical protein